MDGAKKAAFLEIHQVIKYVLDAKNLGLKIEPDRNKEGLLLSMIAIMQVFYENEYK